jgi:NADH:ubiquinone oxidoreductase subunit 6 (subunit J)
VTLEIAGFCGVALALLGSSLAVVITPNLFHAVLFLAVALVATGGVFLLLGAPFLFGVQLLLYAGGVVTIVVFAIMLTERLVGERIGQASRHVFNGAVVAAAVLAGIVGFLLKHRELGAGIPTAGDTTVDIGKAVVGPFAASLELLGILLVAALLGALYFARTED